MKAKKKKDREESTLLVTKLWKVKKQQRHSEVVKEGEKKEE